MSNDEGPTMTKMATTARAPETKQQAQTWDLVKRNYRAAGLCHRCAAQAAWGHQCGFSVIEPPCAWCLPLVLDLPVNASGDWRKLRRGRVRQSDTYGARSGPETLGNARVRISGEHGKRSGRVCA